MSEDPIRQAINDGVADHSMITLMADCPRKFKYVYEEGYVLPVGEKALFSKNLVHRSIGMWYAGREVWPWEELWNDHTKDCVDNGIDPSMLKYDINVARTIFDKYTEQFANDRERYSCLPEDTIIVPGFIITKPDVSLFDKQTDEAVPLDLKVTFRTGGQYPDFYHQFLGQMKGLGAKKYIIAHILVEQGVRIGIRITIVRNETTPASDLIEEFEDDWTDHLAELAWRREHNRWPKRTQSCLKFNQKCGFWDVCHAGHFAGNVLQSIPHREDPFAYLRSNNQDVGEVVEYQHN